MINSFRLTRFANSTFEILLFILILGLLGSAGYYTYTAEKVANKSYNTVVNAVDSSQTPAVHDFNSCQAAGNQVLMSYPEVCVTASGQRFTQQ